MNQNNSGNLYPFVTKAQIKEKLESDPLYRCEAMAILHTLQTEHEQATKSTLSKNRQGFMSSHAVKGSEVAVKIKAGEKLTEEDWKTVDKIAPRYSRQLATFARAQAIASDPALAKTAALFSADKNLPDAPVVEESAEIVEEAVEAEPEGDDSQF
jgi:hypothetical protein